MVRTLVTHSAIASCATFLFLPHFDVICDLLLNRRMATWNLFALYNNEDKALFISKSFNISYTTRKPAFAGPLPTLANATKAI